MSTNTQRRVTLKTPQEIALMRDANLYAAEILIRLTGMVCPGISTWDLDAVAREELQARGLESPFLGYYGYPAVICTSVNEEIVHGIPRKDKILSEGDIIGIDIGAVYKDFVADTVRTVPVGVVSSEIARLIAVTSECLDAAIAQCSLENRLSDLGKSVQALAEKSGYSVVRDFVGHGIGRRMHEEPQVLNYYNGVKPRLKAGLVLAIEPMLNMGTAEVEVLQDGWTAVTRDRKWSAHFEDSIAITEKGPLILSRL